VNVFGFFVCLFLIKESPRYLLETGRNEHAFINLKYYASMNGKISQFSSFVHQHELHFKDGYKVNIFEGLSE